MDSTRRNHEEEGPAELLRSFRWTQRLAQKLVRDPGLAADLHQETWVRAVERFGDAIPGRKWLAGTVRSMAFRARRGEGRRRAHETRGAQPDSVEGVEELLMRSEAQQRVAAAVGRLPRDLQIPVLLHFQEGLTLGAIAKRLDCPKSTAGDRVQRGLAALRRELQSEGGGWSACCLLAVPFGALPPAASVALKVASGAASTSSAATGALGITTLTGVAMKKLVLAGAFVALALLGALAVKLTAPTAAPTVPSETASAAGLGEPVDPSPNETVTPAVTRSAKRTPKAAPSAPGPLARPDEFVFTARVFDSQDQPIPRPRMLVTAGAWRHQTEGTDDGSVQLRLSASDLETIEEKNVNVLISGSIYQTLYSRYIRADGTGKLAPPTPGRVEDLGSVTLRPAGAVQGLATSTTRSPIAGAEVSTCDYQPEDPDSRSAYSGVEPDVVTQDDGTFLLGHLAPGMVSLYVEHSGFLVKAPLTSVEVLEGVTVGPVSLIASPADIVTGRVQNRMGDPIEGVYVNGTDNWSRRDTDQTGPDGRFRIGLRKGSPAAVLAHFPGWRQISPPRDALSRAGEVNIVMEPVIPDAAFTVAIVDAKSDAHIYRVAIAVLKGGENSEASGGPEDGTETGIVGQPMVQPKGGLPLDFVPGIDRIQVTADGYQTAIVTTEGCGEEAPHMTVKLVRAAGVRGRLLENGEPIAGALVKLKRVGLHVAEPREALRDGSTIRLETERDEGLAMTGQGSYSPESVLGLDGDPPPYRLVPASAMNGTRTDDQGYFQFPTAANSPLCLFVQGDGRPARAVRTLDVENGTLDLGDVEIAPPATLTGRFEFSSPWDPTEVVVVVDGLGRSASLGEDGSFTLDGLQPGPVYFSLTQAGLMGLPAGLMPFEDAPVFHVNLAPGEKRSLVISLDPFAPSSLALNLTVGGRPLPDLRRIEVVPVNEPNRPFRLWCQVEDSLVTADTRALGPCRVAIIQSSRAGWLRLPCPGPPLDLRPGQTARRTLDIPAGRLRMTMDPLHAGGRYGAFDLTLDSGGAPLEVLGVQPAPLPTDAATATGADAAPRSLVTAFLPTGTYHATLRPSRNRHGDSKDEVLAEFDVLIHAGEVTEIELSR